MQDLSTCSLRSLSDTEADGDDLGCLALPCICAIERELLLADEEHQRRQAPRLT